MHCLLGILKIAHKMGKNPYVLTVGLSAINRFNGERAAQVHDQRRTAMRIRHFLLSCVALGLVGCGGNPPMQSGAMMTRSGPSATNSTMVADPQGFQVVKLSTPTVTADEAIAAVKARFQDDEIDGISAQLKTLQWAADHLGYAQHLYSSDSPAWIVSVTGQLSGDPGLSANGTPVPHTFKTGRVVVAADDAQLINVNLYLNGFVPSSVDPNNVGSRIVSANPAPSPAVTRD